MPGLNGSGAAASVPLMPLMIYGINSTGDVIFICFRYQHLAQSSVGLVLNWKPKTDNFFRNIVPKKNHHFFGIFAVFIVTLI